MTQGQTTPEIIGELEKTREALVVAISHMFRLCQIAVDSENPDGYNLAEFGGFYAKISELINELDDMS